MNVRNLLLLEKVPKLNFTVSHLVISAPLYTKTHAIYDEKLKTHIYDFVTYKIDNDEFYQYYLYTRAYSETFPLVILSEVPLEYPLPPLSPMERRVFVMEGPFRITIKNREHKKFWWTVGTELKHTNKLVEIFIRRAPEKDHDFSRSTKLVISGCEKRTMTRTFRQTGVLINPAEGDLVILDANTDRRFSNYAKVFITRRSLTDILSTAETPHYDGWWGRKEFQPEVVVV